MAYDTLIFRVHAVQRMAERKIDVGDVHHILANGEIIKIYSDDTPYPRQLILGWLESRPVHIVTADIDVEQ